MYIPWSRYKGDTQCRGVDFNDNVGENITAVITAYTLSLSLLSLNMNNNPLLVVRDALSEQTWLCDTGARAVYGRVLAGRLHGADLPHHQGARRRGPGRGAATVSGKVHKHAAVAGNNCSNKLC